MIRRIVLVVLLQLLAVSYSQANIIPSVERMVNPGSAAIPYDLFPTNAFATDLGMNSGAPQSSWVSYVFSLTPTDGEKITTLDISISMPLSSGRGFAQRWTLDADDPSAPAVPTPSNASVTNGDSHLIVGGSIQFVAPVENKFDARRCRPIRQLAITAWALHWWVHGASRPPSRQRNRMMCHCGLPTSLSRAAPKMWARFRSSRMSHLQRNPLATPSLDLVGKNFPAFSPNQRR